MNNYLNIPEHFDLANQLEKLLQRILNTITIDSIFLSGLQQENELSYYFLTAFIDANIDPVPNEMIRLIQRIEKDYPDFKIRLYTEATSELALERGSLYFLEHCCLGTKVYSNSEGEVMLDYQNLALKGLLKRAQRYYNSEIQKVNAFVKAANELIKCKQHGIAVFNIHQAFELTFRFIEQMLIGKCRITHSIISHIKYCEPYFSNLHPFKDTQNLNNNELLVLLEHAYNTARYGDEYQINKSQTKAIQAELKDFIIEAEDLFNTHLNYCKAQIEDAERKTVELEPVASKETSHTDNSEAAITEESIQSKLDDLINQKFYKVKLDSKEGYYKTEFMITGLSDVLYDIASIMKVCIITLGSADSYYNKLIPQPNINVKTTLEHILQLLPFEEMECLEDIANQNINHHGNS